MMHSYKSRCIAMPVVSVQASKSEFCPLKPADVGTPQLFVHLIISDSLQFLAARYTIRTILLKICEFPGIIFRPMGFGAAQFLGLDPCRLFERWILTCWTQMLRRRSSVSASGYRNRNARDFCWVVPLRRCNLHVYILLRNRPVFV